MAGAAVPGRLIWRVATLKKTIPETSRVSTLLFEVPEWPGHLAGQHVDVRLTAEDGYQAQRSYSIASAPEDRLLALTVEGLEDGEVSPYLMHEMQEGDQVELRGPVGGYFVWAASRTEPLLLVGGGSGVVPLVSMIRHRTEAGSTVPAALLYSSRAFEDIIYREELERLAVADPSIRIHHTLTRSAPAGWSSYTRRVDRAMLREVLPGVPGETLAYVCGPTGFVETVSAGLVDLGIDPRRVLTERFGPT